MRLINTTTYKVEEFIGDAFPNYVILSHTWEDGELSLQDMMQDRARFKAGYKKVRYTCEQGFKDGFKYAWVDTCCIDKTSSAELSEAINSMFRWYKNAQICYVYLADLDAEPLLNEGPLKRRINRDCRWFSRGWTLQELLAPDAVEFYDRKWRYQGSKTSLAVPLSEITDIPERLLRFPEYLKEYSVAQIFSWASERKTTRVEDRAYSLLGLFDVNMPLLYGEGDKAFFRLQKKILKTTPDTTILAWSQTFMGESEDCGLLANRLDQFRFAQNVMKDKENHHQLNPVLQPDRILVDLFVRLDEIRRSPAVAYLGCRTTEGDHVCVKLIPSMPSHATGPEYRRWGSPFSLKSEQSLHEKGFNLQRLTFSLRDAGSQFNLAHALLIPFMHMPRVNISLRSSPGVKSPSCRIRGLHRSWGVYSLTLLEHKPIPDDVEDMSLAITVPIWPAYEHRSDVRAAAALEDDFETLCKVSASLTNDSDMEEPRWSKTTTVCIADITEAGSYVAGIVVGLQAFDSAHRIRLASERNYQHDDVYHDYRYHDHLKNEDSLDMTVPVNNRLINISAIVRRQGCPRHSGCNCEVHHLSIELDSKHPLDSSTPAEPSKDQMMNSNDLLKKTHTQSFNTLDEWSSIPGLEGIQLSSVAPIDSQYHMDLNHYLSIETGLSTWEGD